MSGVDLHPEDLLDREARGELSDAEAGRLAVHLTACAACRFERLARADFRDETERAAGPLDVQRLLSAVLAPEQRAPATAPPRRVSRLRLMLAAAAVVTIAGVSMAAAPASCLRRTPASSRR